MMISILNRQHFIAKITKFSREFDWSDGWSSIRNSPRTRRIAAICLGAITVYLFIVSVLIWDALGKVRNLESNYAGSEIESTDDSIVVFLGSIDGVNVAVSRVKTTLFPVDFLCAGTSWIGPIGTQCDAYETAFGVFDQSIAIAADTLDTAILLQDLLNEIDEAGASAFSSDWDSELTSIGSRFESAVAGADQIVFTAQEAEGANPIIDSLLSRGVSAATDMRELAEWASLVVTTLKSGTAMADEFEAMIDDLAGAADSDFVRYQGALHQVSIQTQEFGAQLDAVVETLPTPLYGSTIESRLVSAHGQIADIVELVTALDSLAQIVGDSIAAGREAEGSFITGGGLSALLTHLDNNIEELDYASSVLARLPEIIEQNSLMSSLIGSDPESGVLSLGEDKVNLLKLLPDMHGLISDLVGIGTSRRYLVLGQSPSEIRPIGGFTSSVWAMNFDNGVLIEMEFIPIKEFGEDRYLDELPPVPAPLAVHMDAKGWYLRDVGWSPDFGSVADTALEMASSANYRDFDGVLAVNQNAVLNLITAIGSIEIDGTVIAASEINTVIEERTDDSGTGFLQELFQATMDSMSGEIFESKFIDVSKAILDDFDSRNIMIQASDDDLAGQLKEVGWDGAFSPSFGDSVAVFDSNVGWNKVDVNISREISYELNISPDGSSLTRINLNYSNHSRVDQEGCAAQAPPPIGQNRYSILQHGCYWNYVRVYIPAQAYDVVLPELIIPDNSLAATTGNWTAGTNSSEEASDDAGRYVGGLLVVPAGEQVDMLVEYSLPPGAASQILADGDISLDIIAYPQPGTQDRTLHGHVTLPAEYEISSISTGEVGGSRSSATFEVKLDSLDRISIYATQKSVVQ